MATDDYGQSITIPALTDTPNIATIGTSLNTMVGRTILRFASASSRNATITSPVEGMLAWLQDVNWLTMYDGTAWVVVSAGTQSWTTIGLVSGFAHNGNSNGTLQYRVVNFFGETSIFFQGAVSVTYSGVTIPNGGILNTSALPTSARPSSLRTIVIPCSDVTSDRITLKLDVQTDGFLKVFGTGTGNTPPWIGFNGTFTSL